jgi:tripartite-type tricarboxylate transporter receptor subunit TctC
LNDIAKRYRRWCILVTTFCLFVTNAAGQEYPSKPVRILVGFIAGSGTDTAARLLAQKLDEPLKQLVIVDNRPGAGGNVASELVAKAAPDGYTLLMAAASIAIQPAMRVKLPFDVPRSFTPISMVATGPFVLVVHPSVPARSARELVAIARSKPGILNYASSGAGSSAHLQGELFNALTKTRSVHVPYKGSPQAVLAAVNGEVDFSFPSITGAQPLLDSGRLRAIGVSTAKRTSLMPNLATLHESGVAGYDRTGWYALLGPAGISRDVLARLDAATRKAVSTPETRSAFLTQGLEVETSTPEQLAEFIKREVEQNIDLARNAGIEKQ